jgi:folate-dependent phosphoribosylglycinamide formyltransferase PurN
MRLIRLKLRGSVPFWILKPIMLQEGQETSPLIDVDVLTDDQKDIINKSIGRHEVSLYDPDGARIEGNLSNVNVMDGNRVTVEDIEEEEELYPEIISVTVDEPEEEEVVPPEVYADAQVLLSKNGNTVKKLVSAMKKNAFNHMVQSVSLELEAAGKNRQGVLHYIEKAISEY